MEADPRNAGDVPPERQDEDKPEGVEGGGDMNPERLGPVPAAGDEPPADEDEDTSREPPAESSPGEPGVTAPKR